MMVIINEVMYTAGVTGKGHTLQCHDLTVIFDCLQICASIERGTTKAGDAVRDGDAGQAGAAEESRVSNAGNAVRDGDIVQAGAVRESRVSNAGDAVRDGDAGQAGAATECVSGNSGWAFWYGYTGKFLFTNVQVTCRNEIVWVAVGIGIVDR